GSAEASKSGERPAVVFSRLVTVRPGDVLDIRTRFDLTIHNSKDNAPFTGTSIFLTRRRTATFGDRAMTVVARAGQNCVTTCSFTRLGAIRSPVGGRLYVNVTVVVKDAAQAEETRAARTRRVRERAARAAPKIQLVVALLLVPSVLLMVAAALVASLAR
ncbi:MAG TPA: hypothetical protein VKA96_08480, partial [Solirubrobacteraceae bacterium]|nr:hypothetical protein [Solirubrobacteraceae bacterium]